MAKKKSNPHSEDANNKPTKTQQQIPDDVSSEKLESLKSLNAMLLKETVERRHQVDSLTQKNGSLKSELNRCNSDKVLLETELNRCNLDKVSLETELNRCNSDKISLESELNLCHSDKVSLETDLTRCNSDKVSLESELNRLSERAERLEIEKGLASAFVSVQVTEMAERIGGFERDVKRVLEEERSVFRARLDRRMEHEIGLLSKLTEAEKREVEVLEKYRKMKGVYDRLVQDQMAIERKVDLITSEKDLVERNLAESNGLLVELKRDIKKIANEKKAIEDERNMEEQKKNEAIELVHMLQKGEEELVMKVSDLEKKCIIGFKKEAKMSTEIDFLVKEKKEIEGRIRILTHEKTLGTKDLKDAKNAIATLENSSMVQIDKLKKLESELGHYQTNLDNEKLTVKNLRKMITKMEKGIEEKSALADDINNLKNSLTKTQKEHEDTKAKLTRSETNTTQILKILKTTSSICNTEDNNSIGISQETELEEDMKDHVTEIEAIKKAFKMLKIHVAKAEKGKRFWRMVTSATTVLAAAVSFAYVVGGGY